MSQKNKQKANVLIIGVMTPQNSNLDKNSYFNEFKSLIDSNNIYDFKEMFLSLRAVDPGTFLTKGKLEDLKKFCIENKINEIVFSEILNATQEKNLEKILFVDVYDRTHLILEIFEKRAQTAEAKMQVQIAFLEHKKTRVSGRGKYFSQQTGRIGAKGPGETQKTIDLQHIEHLLTKMRRDIKHLKEIRSTQRKQREKNKIKRVSLVGYTNAGKSTLFNALTNSSVFVEDKLFATLDTTTREFFIGSNKILLSDTVGFIQNIPHKLVDAFHSTLEELQFADLLIHVADGSNKNVFDQIKTVNAVLKEIDVSEKPILLLINKIDLISKEQFDMIKEHFPIDAFFVSAHSKDDVSVIKEKINLIINSLK